MSLRLRPPPARLLLARWNGPRETNADHVWSLTISVATTGPGVSRTLAQRRSGQPPRVIALADKAQQRLCRRFRRLAEHKPGPVVTVAVARELVGFLWAALHPKAA